MTQFFNDQAGTPLPDAENLAGEASSALPEASIRRDGVTITNTSVQPLWIRGLRNNDGSLPNDPLPSYWATVGARIEPGAQFFDEVDRDGNPTTDPSTAVEAAHRGDFVSQHMTSMTSGTASGTSTARLTDGLRSEGALRMWAREMDVRSSTYEAARRSYIQEYTEKMSQNLKSEKFRPVFQPEPPNLWVGCLHRVNLLTGETSIEGVFPFMGESTNVVTKGDLANSEVQKVVMSYLSGLPPEAMVYGLFLTGQPWPGADPRPEVQSYRALKQFASGEPVEVVIVRGRVTPREAGFSTRPHFPAEGIPLGQDVVLVHRVVLQVVSHSEGPEQVPMPSEERQMEAICRVRLGREFKGHAYHLGKLEVVEEEALVFSAVSKSGEVTPVEVEGMFDEGEIHAFTAGDPFSDKDGRNATLSFHSSPDIQDEWLTPGGGMLGLEVRQFLNLVHPSGLVVPYQKHARLLILKELIRRMTPHANFASVNTTRDVGEGPCSPSNLGVDLRLLSN